MNPQFKNILTAPSADQRDLFASVGNELGIRPEYIEKDFWVCLVLDALFNGRSNQSPKIVFKGGTSLSKAHNLIRRFSEDIDITVFRADIGQEITLAQLAHLSNKKRDKQIDAIKAACESYVHGDLKNELQQLLPSATIEADRTTNSDQQPLLIHFPSVIKWSANYGQQAVKIEAGARSETDPCVQVKIHPYATKKAVVNLEVSNVSALAAERTFWEKVIMLHQAERRFNKKRAMQNDGQRMSRHYYDVHMLANQEIGIRAGVDHDLCRSCHQQAKLSFGHSKDELEDAIPGTFTIMPTDPEMVRILEKDYAAMSGMIFGDVPTFEDILSSLQRLQSKINATSP